jgi:hypothetical protein
LIAVVIRHHQKLPTDPSLSSQPVLARKLTRAVYFMLKNRQGFSLQKFLTV